MKEGLLLDRVALHAGDVSPGHAQHAVVVEAHLADAHGARGNRAIVAAGVAPDPAVRLPIVDLAFTSAGRQQLAERGHGPIVRRSSGSSSVATHALRA